MDSHGDVKLEQNFRDLYLLRIKKSWHWLLLVGAFFLILGSICIFNSLLATIVSLYIFGVSILLSGLGYFIYSLKFLRKNLAKMLQYFFLGLAYFILGVLIVQDPVGASFPLTEFLAFFYIFVGTWRIFSAFNFKAPHSRLEIFGGIFSLVFGIVIWLHWPSSSLWVIGLFVGIDLAMIGIFFTALALFAKNTSISLQ